MILHAIRWNMVDAIQTHTVNEESLETCVMLGKFTTSRIRTFKYKLLDTVPRSGMRNGYITTQLSHSGIQDPDLGLERTLRNGYEAGQEHILEMHEPFTDLPPFIGRSVHRMFLGSSCEPQWVRVSAVM